MPVKYILEDLRTHRERFLAQGFWALLVYRLSRPRLKFRNKLIRAPYYVVNRIMQKTVEVICGIHLPESTIVGRRLNLEHFGNIVIHGSCIIGDDVTIRQGVTLGNKGESAADGAPKIGNRVDIGAGAKLIGDITIGDDVKIGANAVVLTDVPSGSIAVGVPARIISRGNPHTLNATSTKLS